MMNNLFAFYGSLRPGFYNFEYRKEYIEVVEDDVILKGIGLFTVGNNSAYPYATKEKGAETVVTICKIDDPSMQQSIDRMEKGAGYDYHEFDINGLTCGVYLVESLPEQKVKVTNGDWRDYTPPKK